MMLSSNHPAADPVGNLVVAETDFKAGGFAEGVLRHLGGQKERETAGYKGIWIGRLLPFTRANGEQIGGSGDDDASVAAASA